MHYTKLPFVSEESTRVQRVEVYLNDLKQRLRELHLRQDELIHNSVEIIKEIDEVSSKMLVPEIRRSVHIKSMVCEDIKKEEPSSKQVENVCANFDIHRIMDNFEKLNSSHVLKESLVLFKRAKESFQKINTYILDDDDDASSSSSIHTQKAKYQYYKSPTAEMLDSSNDIKEDSQLNSKTPSCCSILSNNDSESIEGIRSDEQLLACSENGYEGDNDDSDYDMIALTKHTK